MSRPIYYGCCVWTLTVFDLLMTVCFGWILIDLETSPIQPNYPNDADTISILLIQNAAKLEATMGLGLMMAVLCMILRMNELLTAGMFLACFAIANMSVSLLLEESCGIQDCLIPSLLMIAIPGIVVCILYCSRHSRGDNELSTSTKLKENFRLHGSAIQKSASVLYILAISFQAVWIILSLLIPADYADESLGAAAQYIRTEMIYQAAFGVLFLLTLCIIGPRFASFGILVLCHLVVIAFGWVIYGELKEVGEDSSSDVVHRQLYVVVCFMCVLPFLIVGWIFQCMVPAIVGDDGVVLSPEQQPLAP